MTTKVVATFEVADENCPAWCTTNHRTAEQCCHFSTRPRFAGADGKRLQVDLAASPERQVDGAWDVDATVQDIDQLPGFEGCIDQIAITRLPALIAALRSGLRTARETEPGSQMNAVLILAEDIAAQAENTLTSERYSDEQRRGILCSVRDHLVDQVLAVIDAEVD